MAHGSDTVEVIHRHALAVLDHDRIAVAKILLAPLPAGVRQSDFEVSGAVGRVRKWGYLTSGRWAPDIA